MFVIGDAHWIWPAAAVLAVALLLLWASYRTTRAPHRVRIVCGFLKAAGFVLLTLFLFEPLWSGVRARPGANLFLILADNSRSLVVRDADDGPSRSELLKSLLQDRKASWRTRLEQDFDVRKYQFGAAVETRNDYSDLDFSGSASRMHSALRTLAGRFHGRPVAGVLLLTDGNATDAQTLDTVELPPVYPVPIESDSGLPDLAIKHVAVSQTAFEDAPVTVQADVSAHGFAGHGVSARIVDEKQQVVAELAQAVAGEADDASLTFRFQLRPPAQGVSFYTVEVRAADAVDSTGASQSADEAASTPAEPRPSIKTPASESAPHAEVTLENNRRTIQISRGAGRKRILYVSGRPNWEFKFIRRALEDDPSLELAALLRIARREAKFDFRGRAGESSNPLFRGFKQEADAETESHDEPVIVRINMRDAEELRGGFPKSDEELFRFHAVILDDLEAGFFTQDKLELLERFVSERGGGLLMLGGQESFARGEYEHTPVARLLPVYLDRGTTTTAAVDNSYRLLLTRDGWLQPWTRLRANETDERERLEEMPPFKTLNHASDTKPGAVVLAEAVDDAGHRHPALVSQRYGHGRSAALLFGDMWRWRLKLPAENDDHGKAWRQAVRWLVADVPEAVTVEVHTVEDAAPGAVRFRVKAFDPGFQPIDDAEVELRVNPAGGEPLTLHAEPSLDEPGVFHATYLARQPCPCRIVATITDHSGAAAGTAEAGWVSDPAADEFHSIGVNRELLETLAAQTGGHLVQPGDLDEFAASLSTRDVPISESWTYPLWHQAWVFALVTACFIGEWGLRRMKGLP